MFGIFNSEFITMGGVIQEVLLVLSVATFALVLERVWYWAAQRVTSTAIGRKADADAGDIFFIYVRAVAPLLGILGTVQGIIRAFARIGQSTELDFSAMVADVSLALYTTAFGLIVAVACILGLGINEMGRRRIAL